jgi:hypothetical protein
VRSWEGEGVREKIGSHICWPNRSGWWRGEFVGPTKVGSLVGLGSLLEMLSNASKRRKKI